MHPLQEKLQITVPAKEEAGDQWVSAKSQRCVHGVPVTDTKSKYNFTPPGMEMGNQEFYDQPKMSFVMAGTTDVSEDTNPAAFAEGFKKRDMKASDDQYTGEHVDHFYGDAGGFVERNNYLDRE